ncbi:MAG: Ig-like domain-containing protein, partial [Promethearchaeota archaeon]
NLTQHLSWNLTTIDLITFGLPVGAYALNITAETSTTRVGIVSITEFSIMSTTQIELTQESLTGMVSEQHSFVLGLRDSLSELVGDADIWVSVYNPSNREIFGSPLTEKTLLHVGSAVSWLPTIVGEYRVFLEFEGNAFLNSSTLEFRILIRYPSSITLEMPEFMEYGNVVPITATLRGALGSISGAVLTLTVSSYGVETRVETLTTGSRGIATVNLASLLSGTHTITVEYGGSSTQASFETQLDIKIIPLVMISVEPVSEMYVGHYCSVNLSVSVLGTASNWTGTIDAKMYDPDGKQVTEWNFGVGVHTILKLGFNAQKVGTHSLNVTLNGLPIIVSKEYPLAVVIVDESLQLELDAGTTPLLGGFSIITIIGIALRKKLKDVLESLPGDWSD